MHDTIADLFRPGRTRNLRIRPNLQPSTLLLNGNLWVLPQPLPGAVDSHLVLIHRTLDQHNLQHLASTIVGLPGVLTPGPTGFTHCGVPLIAPDEAAADSLTWFIAPGLTLRETHQSTELTTALPPNRFTPCFSLRGSQWRRLAQALLSADLWQEHLAGLARTVAATLRTQLSEQARADRGVLIRIFHRIDDNRAVEMFSYRDSTSHNVQEVLRQVHKHLTDVPEQSPGAPVAHPRTRGATDEQTLLVGDLVAVDGEFYRNELIEWRRVAPPAVIENAPPGATQP